MNEHSTLTQTFQSQEAFCIVFRRTSIFDGLFEGIKTPCMRHASLIAYSTLPIHCLFMLLFVCLFVCFCFLFVCLFVFLFVCVFVRLCFCLFVFFYLLFVCVFSFIVFFSLNICLRVFIFLSGRDENCQMVIETSKASKKKMCKKEERNMKTNWNKLNSTERNKKTHKERQKNKDEAEEGRKEIMPVSI